ncbi:hypothetical protein ZIOFF_011539 [Zingiber officinale]|uniref:Uncharacterized protein n=1 Tax=Zingiber officinale TaxID=94328 RepID=A0A8J5I698_ZINOF|nr:hypothetical protein ZIOFF_011539 [Zingiber officinale]
MAAWKDEEEFANGRKNTIDAEIHARMEALTAMKIHYLDRKEITLRTDSSLSDDQKQFLKQVDESMDETQGADDTVKGVLGKTIIALMAKVTFEKSNGSSLRLMLPYMHVVGVVNSALRTTKALHWVPPLCAPPRHRVPPFPALGASALRTAKALGAPFPALGASALRTTKALHRVPPLCAEQRHRVPPFPAPSALAVCRAEAPDDRSTDAAETKVITEVVLPSIWEDTPWEEDPYLDIYGTPFTVSSAPCVSSMDSSTYFRNCF